MSDEMAEAAAAVPTPDAPPPTAPLDPRWESLRDKWGQGFEPDSDYHLKNPDGSPRLTREGLLWPRGGRPRARQDGAPIPARTVVRAAADECPGKTPEKGVSPGVVEGAPSALGAGVAFTGLVQGLGMILLGLDGRMLPEEKAAVQEAAALVELERGAPLATSGKGLAGALLAYLARALASPSAASRRVLLVEAWGKVSGAISSVLGRLGRRFGLATGSDAGPVVLENGVRPPDPS